MPKPKLTPLTQYKPSSLELPYLVGFLVELGYPKSTIMEYTGISKRGFYFILQQLKQINELYNSYNIPYIFLYMDLMESQVGQLKQQIAYNNKIINTCDKKVSSILEIISRVKRAYPGHQAVFPPGSYYDEVINKDYKNYRHFHKVLPLIEELFERLEIPSKVKESAILKDIKEYLK